MVDALFFHQPLTRLPVTARVRWCLACCNALSDLTTHIQHVAVRSNCTFLPIKNNQYTRHPTPAHAGERAQEVPAHYARGLLHGARQRQALRPAALQVRGGLQPLPVFADCWVLCAACALLAACVHPVYSRLHCHCSKSTYQTNAGPRLAPRRTSSLETAAGWTTAGGG